MSELPRELTLFVETLREQRAVPGLALAVTNRDGPVAAQRFGAPDGALFEIGSIGKCFTAVLTLLLREEGKLALDEPVSTYLPWFEVGGAHEPITLHHLLSHTGGLIMGADQTSDSRFDVWALRETEAGFPPGRHFHYSNVGFRALGYALEELTGQRYPELVRERILEPLGLVEAEPAVTSAMRARLAVGHERLHDDRPPRRTDPLVPATWLETSTADGCLAMPPEELAAFVRMLLNRGRDLLSEESFAHLTMPVIASEGDWLYGYGLEVRAAAGRTEIHHGGSMVGYGSVVLGDLDAGLGVAVLVNGPDEENLTEQVAAAALAFYRDGTVPAAPRDPLAVDDPGRYEGVFRGTRGSVALQPEGERLRLEHEGGALFLEERRNGFLADHPELGSFLLRFEGEGAPERLVHGGDVYVRDGTGEAAPALPEDWRPFPGFYRAYNPWLSSFHVVARGDRLVLVYPVSGFEDALEPVGPAAFRAGEAWSPERLRFDAIVDGSALRANLSGCDYYRMPSP